MSDELPKGLRADDWLETAIEGAKRKAVDELNMLDWHEGNLKRWGIVERAIRSVLAEQNNQLELPAVTIDRLTGYLYAVGICSKCGGEFEHHIDEPFASCPKGCWQGEDTGGPPLLQRLRKQIVTRQPITVIPK